MSRSLVQVQVRPPFFAKRRISSEALLSVGWTVPFSDLFLFASNGTAMKSRRMKGFPNSCPYTVDFLYFGDWRNWLAHVLWEHGVVGSSPTSPTISVKYWVVGVLEG